MRILMFILSLTCVPYLAFGSNNNNDDDEWFNPKNMFSSNKPTKKEEAKKNEEWFNPKNLFSSTNNTNNTNKNNENNKNNEKTDKNEEKGGHYPKFPASTIIPKDCEIDSIHFGSGNNLLIVEKLEGEKKRMYNIPPLELETKLGCLAMAGNFSITFYSFTGRELDSKKENMEISTYMPPYLCSLGGYTTIKFGETIEIPRRDIQFINFKLNTDEKSAIGIVDENGKNFDFRNISHNKSRVRHLNYRAGLATRDEINIRIKDQGIVNAVYLHVWFRDGIYRYGHSYIPMQPQEPK